MQTINATPLYTLDQLTKYILREQAAGYQVKKIWSQTTWSFRVIYFVSMVTQTPDNRLHDEIQALRSKGLAVQNALNPFSGGMLMAPGDSTPAPSLDQDIQTVKDTEGVLDSVLVFINGVTARIQAAVDAAKAAATADANAANQALVASLEAELANLKSKAQTVAQAIAG